MGRNIRKCRIELGLLQSGLAARIGYSVKTISKWECGKGAPPAEVLPALAKHLHTSIEAFYRKDDKGSGIFWN
ncbi:MAG: helix-turn-helix transcriptional regulator [Clostridia bacterium]|nr:helix-turn-helix transcriptional regulator [Clostridia bacterium]